MDRYLTTMKGSVRKDSDVSPKVTHGMFINLRSPTEEKFQYKLPKTLHQQYPRKNKLHCRLHYTIKKFDTSNMDNSQLSPNSSLANDYFSLFSRSAKIMKALSSNSHSLRNETVKTRKLLNFDSTPSPKQDSSYDNSSSSIDTDTSLTPLNSSMTDSTDNHISTVEAIDENQNKTPQQNRKHVKKSKRTDLRENTHIWSRASRLMSLLDKEQREGKKETDKDANHKTFQRFLFNSRSNELGRVITASTPRNLFQEFNQETDDRPNTPENIINLIPESISAIKKSHKKEKLYCYEESSTQRMDISVNNGKQLHSRSTIESLSTDVIAETSTVSESESQKKYRNPKRTLIYNLDDECSDIRSNFDHNMQQKMPTGIGLLESELKDQIESDELQNINFSNCESREESMQSSIDDNDEEKKTHSEENVYNEEVSQSSMQKESSDNCNVNATSENGMASPASNPIVSQDSNQVVTPENHVNVLKHMMTESIKKSHKKMKHGNRKKLFETKDVHQKMELAKNERSLLENAYDDQDMKNQTADSICVSSPQNFDIDRPSTPENVNSSRLLLLDFNSVKKSHKKDKRSKRAASFTECHDYEYHKRSNNLLQSSRYEEDIGIISRGNESLEVKESPGMSPKKKKKLSMPLECSTPKVASASKFLGCKNIDDDFKIYTPIKKRPILLTVTDVPADQMLQERDEPMPSMSNEIDYSRCMTPIARFKELRNNEDLASERDNATEFETDTSVLKAADTANLNDNNGRSTPINMSTMELLYNIDSIKKSHRKNKHNPNSRPTSEKKRSYIEEGHVNFINNEKMLEERISSFSKHRVDYHCPEKETCNITQEQEKNKNYKEIDYNPKPSTSHKTKIKDAKSTASKSLNTTPPNSLSAMRLIKLLQTTSIKKSHKKERDMNAQTKYILMSEEHELSDDGSIFDEEDKLNFMETNDSNTEITTM